DATVGFDRELTKRAFREETDRCVRIRRSGYRVVYQPEAVVLHSSLRFRRRSTFFSPAAQFSLARNNAYFVAKNVGGHRAMAYWLVVAPLIDPARELASALAWALLAPVRMAGAGIGWVRGANRRNASSGRLG